MVDFDRVEQKNTMSQMHTGMCVGRNKAEAIAKLMQGLYKLRIKPLPRFPSMVRDLSLVLPQKHSYAEVAATIRSVDREMVVDVTPFDRYAGKGLPEGTVGLSVSICFQHRERTLVSDEVDVIQGRIVAALETKLGARLRSGDSNPKR